MRNCEKLARLEDQSQPTKQTKNPHDVAIKQWHTRENFKRKEVIFVSNVISFAFFDRVDIEGFFRKTIRVVQQQQLLL